MAAKREYMLRVVAEYYGRHFDARCTKNAHGSTSVLHENFVNLTMPAGSTDLDTLVEFGRSAFKPFRVKFLSEKLKEQKYTRGRVCSGDLADMIGVILLNYPYLRWWLEKDGLVVDEARSEVGFLSDFDRLSGPLVSEQMKEGKLAVDALASIAAKLDAEGLTLKYSLQPKQWISISDFNQKHPKSPVKTFEAAVRRPEFARSVRRRLYLARVRYTKALRPATPIFVKI